MNRRLQFLNLIGVVVLALVCVLQWRRDRALNLELNRIEKTRLEQQATLAEREKNPRGLTDDLALFKEQLARMQSEAGDARKKFRELEQENQLLASARDQLQASVTNWANAVAARDKLIAEANENIGTDTQREKLLERALQIAYGPEAEPAASGRR